MRNLGMLIPAAIFTVLHLGHLLRIHMQRRAKEGEIYAVTHQKGDEMYIVLYEKNSSGTACTRIGRWADNPELSLDWGDAAYMSGVIRQGE